MKDIHLCITSNNPFFIHVQWNEEIKIRRETELHNLLYKVNYINYTIMLRRNKLFIIRDTIRSKKYRLA